MSNPVRVLHLEGDPVYAALVQETLERDGLSAVIGLATSREQFEQLIETPCDLVLADYAMPRFDGATVLRMVVILTADASVRQQRRVLAAGAVAYLTKPLDVAALLRIIDERLAVRSDG